jgi:hypothetical protein
MRALLGGALAVSLMAGTAGAKEIAPFHADLVVRWGRGAGSDAFRDELARIMAEALATRCFAGVEIAGGPASDSASELLYTIILSDVVDETRFDDTIAGALQPGDPTQELRRVAQFEVAADATLQARANGAVIHRKHVLAHAYRRPIYVGEDPQAVARAQAAEDLVETLTKSLGCGGQKLLRKIGEALPH